MATSLAVYLCYMHSILLYHYTLLPSANYDSVYVVGALDEALNIRGFRYHPADIEASVVRSHKNVVGR